jgi:ribosome-binding protein aMBF1 (putative translation factor)
MPTDAQRLRDELARLGRSQRGLARELDLDERTVRRYCSGELEVPQIVWMALKAMRPRKPNTPHGG